MSVCRIVQYRVSLVDRLITANQKPQGLIFCNLPGFCDRAAKGGLDAVPNRYQCGKKMGLVGFGHVILVPSISHTGEIDGIYLCCHFCGR